jgi:predicted Zn-dependent peptidase
MIEFERFVLDNGLKVLVHKDDSTPIVAFNLLYNVGARDEDPDKTGFAHLFEHLMFGGSVNIPKFDTPLQLVGGENNAFTNNDFTNYYITIPKQNLETAFWLESDRMLDLAFSEKSLTVQKNVVIEEFKQRYLNQPYGDLWPLIRETAYKVHPYRWPTIGKDISHIEKAEMVDVRGFYSKFYNPANAILCVAGNVRLDEIQKLTDKWFSSINKKHDYHRSLPNEPVQQEKRFLKVERDVPASVLCKIYHICSRNDKKYYATDIISDIFSNGKSSRLYENLVKKNKIFTEIEAFITGELDEGLFIFYGKIPDNISIETADKELEIEISRMKTGIVEDFELNKIKNKIEASNVFSDISCPNKALKLCVAELLGDANLANTELKHYLAVNSAQIAEVSNEIFNENNCSTIYYMAKK